MLQRYRSSENRLNAAVLRLKFLFSSIIGHARLVTRTRDTPCCSTRSYRYEMDASRTPRRFLQFRYCTGNACASNAFETLQNYSRFICGE